MESDDAPARATATVSHSELFEIIIESSVDFAIFTTDENGLTTSWNIGAERLFGFSEQEMLGASADIIFTEEDRAARAPELERERAREESRASDDRWHLRKDGSRFWASGLTMPLKPPHHGFIKITRDRTAQHDAEEKLRENEQRFRLLATSIPQLVFRTRPDGARTWGSPQWINFTGLSFEESTGFGWLDAVHPDDRQATRDAWNEAGKRGEYYMEHRILRRADGSHRWHQTRATPIDEAHAQTGDWVGTTTDIHELKGLKDRQDVLVAELQHRTRNLLAVVQAISRQTLHNSDTLETFGTEYESRLRALSRVQGLIARSEQGEIDLGTMLGAELNAHADPDRRAERIAVSGPPVQLPSGSAQTMALALHELATNAVKYGALHHETGTLTIVWSLEREGAGHWLKLVWRETGVPHASGPLPLRKGYGRELIERALPYQLGARTTLDFHPNGIECMILVPLKSARGADDG